MEKPMQQARPELSLALSRRGFGATGAGAAIALLSGAARSSPAIVRSSHKDPLDGVELYRHVLDYCGFGEHRSGSLVDERTSQWILDHLKSSGFDAQFQTEPMRFFDLKACSVTVGARTVRTYPEWYPTATGPVPVTAPLATLAPGAPLGTLKGKVWLAFSGDSGDKGNIDRKTKDMVDAAGKAGALAAIVVVRSLSGALVGRNASVMEESQKPWCSIPFVGAAGRDEAMLRAAAEQGQPASVLLFGDDIQNHTGRNVIGRIGKARDLIVVTTPHSGMFRAGGERAPGVALLMGMASWLGQRRPNARYLFCSSYGHEINGRGARLFAASGVLPPKEEVKCWLHLGSGSGVWRYERGPNGLTRTGARGGTGNFLASERFTSMVAQAYAHIPDLRPTARVTGDLAAFMEQGYVGFGPSGSNIFTHTEDDGPEQTAPELLGPLARGSARALEIVETL